MQKHLWVDTKYVFLHSNVSEMFHDVLLWSKATNWLMLKQRCQTYGLACEQLTLFYFLLCCCCCCITTCLFPALSPASKTKPPFSFGWGGREEKSVRESLQERKQSECRGAFKTITHIQTSLSLFLAPASCLSPTGWGLLFWEEGRESKNPKRALPRREHSLSPCGAFKTSKV